ncbi:hypothetical protein BGZ94_008078 [Podila epigama]|nr:hypothetical protein BGZ94_008078 [Podila epigama]
MMNLINFRLESLYEIRGTIKTKAKGASLSESEVNREEKRTLGLVILRGETIVNLSVDGPPPPSTEDQKARLSQLAAGTGVAIPAGRGMPVVPGAAPGLTGPVRGVGGPAPGMMLPHGPAAAAPPVAYGRGMPPGGMPPPGFRPLGGMAPPPGMPGMARPPGFTPMGQPAMLPPPGFRPGMPPGPPPPGFRPGFVPGPPG